MTTVLLVSRPAPNMPGYNNTDLKEVHSLSSYPQSSMASCAPGMFSFAQTEPSTDLLSGSSWVPAEGSQNFQDFADHGSSSIAGSDEYIFTSGQSTPRGSKLDQSQTNGPAWNNSKSTSTLSSMAQGMSRVSSSTSRDSSISHGLSNMSESDLTGNESAFTTVPDVHGSLSAIDSCLLLDNDANVDPSQMYWPDYAVGMGLSAESASIPLSNVNSLHVSPAQMHLTADGGLPDDSSPSSWDFSSSISRTSSPATADDAWLPAPISASSSPKSQSQLPMAQQKSVAISVDAIGSGPTESLQSSDGFNMTLPPNFRQGNDGESARDHHLYKNITPQADGLYHCPWEGKASCNHKPEKLKCNYDKFVDSHLKPYRCKVNSCEGARFSSTACLLRHEREAHGLHGHGDKPFLCAHPGCERSFPGSGFPRQWNLRDHMKRVHNDHGGSAASPPSAQTQQPSAKGRKRKTEPTESQPAASRKTSVKSMPAGDAKQTSAKPLIDQWLDHRKALEGLIRGLQKPNDTKNLQQIIEMQKRLDAMAQMESAAMPETSAAASTPNHNNHNAIG